MVLQYSQRRLEFWAVFILSGFRIVRADVVHEELRSTQYTQHQAGHTYIDLAHVTALRATGSYRSRRTVRQYPRLRKGVGSCKSPLGRVHVYWKRQVVSMSS